MLAADAGEPLMKTPPRLQSTPAPSSERRAAACGDEEDEEDEGGEGVKRLRRADSFTPGHLRSRALRASSPLSSPSPLASPRPLKPLGRKRKDSTMPSCRRDR